MKRTLLAAAVALPTLLACSPTSYATKVMANALSSSPSGSAYAEDDDPELVRAAVPFGLKTMEALLIEHPRHVGLLTALASGFTQFSYGFVQADADGAYLRGQAGAAEAARVRARKLFLRARDYGFRGLEVGHHGMAGQLERARDLDAPLATLKKEDVPLVYWTAASWALAIADGKDDMTLVSQLPAPGAMMHRALALDEAWGDGAIHEFFVSWDAAQGGADGLARAKQHFDRAVELSKGRHLGVFVSYAESVCVPRQDRAEFTRVLQHVLSYDVEADQAHRLANVLAQRRARLLLTHVEDLFA